MRFVLPFMRPISGWKVRAWAWLAVLIALEVGLIFYVNLNVTGTRAVDDEVRWAAYIGQIVLAVLAFIPTGSSTDSRRGAFDFRGGDQERAAIVDYQYAIARAGKWMGFRLVAVRTVHRFFGIAAVEIADRTYAFIPVDLFPSKEEWREVQARLASR